MNFRSNPQSKNGSASPSRQAASEESTAEPAGLWYEIDKSNEAALVIPVLERLHIQLPPNCSSLPAFPGFFVLSLRFYLVDKTPEV